MTESMDKIYQLIDELNAIVDDGLTIIPGKLIVSHKELYKIAHAFEESVPEEVQDARRILNKKDEIIEEAKIQAERIIQSAENERRKLLDESNVKQSLMEQMQIFQQRVQEECEQVKMQAFNEAQERILAAKNEAIALKEGAQGYAQGILSNIEQVLNSVYQNVMNKQQQLQDMKTNDSIQKLGKN